MPRLLTVDKRDRMTISKQCLEMFQRNPDEFLRPIHYCRRNMDSLLHTRDEGTVKTMDFIGWTSSEEGEDRNFTVGWKDDDQFFEIHGIIHIDYIPSKRSMIITQPY